MSHLAILLENVKGNISFYQLCALILVYNYHKIDLAY